MADDALPVVDPEDIAESSPTRDVSVWGVLLAAGTSSRYGADNKLLAPVDGVPLVRHAAATLAAAAALDGVVAVVGYQASAVAAAVDDVVTTVHVTDDFEAGQSSSLRVGIAAARDLGADAVVVGLGDMPAVRPETVDRLVEAYERRLGTALAAAYGGRRGNPVLFDASYFDVLTDVEGDVGGRAIFVSASDAALVETADPGVVCDVDRPSDLDEIQPDRSLDG